MFFKNLAESPPSFSEVLDKAIEIGASDVLIRQDLPIMYKVGGLWYRFSEEDLPEMKPYLHALASFLGYEQEEVFMERVRETRDLDLSFSLPSGYRFRANVSLTANGFLMVLRVIRSETLSLSELGFAQESLRALESILLRRRGLLLVTGSTGSGKSTTLAAMISWLNERTTSNIVTIEDPIEYVFLPQRSAIHQREVGPHTESFAKALRSAMRQAPDVIMVGEMRDGETIKAALTAAETGHLVLSTLHTRSAPESITRIIDALPPEDKPMARQQLSASLAGVISQKLLPRSGGGQQVLAYEMFVLTDAVRHTIAKGEANFATEIRNYMRSGKERGMRLMEQSLVDLVAQGLVLPEIAEQYANDPDEYKTLLKAYGLEGSKRGGLSFGGETPPRGRLFGGG